MSSLNQPLLPKVYCAGPLFSECERQEMTAIADALVADGYRVYLPHRDGMEFRLVLEVLVERGWTPSVAAAFLHAGIFALDVYQLAVDCEAMVWNLNGRVPDEGAVSEAAIAWTLGKPLVAFKDDVRSMICGRDNPLLVGLVEFETVENIASLPDALAAAIDRSVDEPVPVERMPAKLRQAILDGRRLWDAMRERDAAQSDALIADIVEELFAPPEGTRV
ncbi:MAG: nucleoside 2-deoxyribosyltransferase [Planctomycetaceae bacterium]